MGSCAFDVFKSEGGRAGPADSGQDCILGSRGRVGEEKRPGLAGLAAGDRRPEYQEGRVGEQQHEAAGQRAAGGDQEDAAALPAAPQGTRGHLYCCLLAHHG